MPALLDRSLIVCAQLVVESQKLGVGQLPVEAELAVVPKANHSYYYNLHIARHLGLLTAERWRDEPINED